MPVSDRYTPPALVANGYIFNTYAELKVGYRFQSNDTTQAQLPRTIEQVYALARFIEADTFWSANAEQIYVNEQQELELIPDLVITGSWLVIPQRWLTSSTG
jgi:cell division protein FtsQ